jgi:hypothetical protein
MLAMPGTWTTTLCSDNLPSSACAAPEHAILADHTAFDGGAVLKFNNAGKYAAVREVHVTDMRATLRDHYALLQLDDAKLGPEVLKIDGTRSR